MERPRLFLREQAAQPHHFMCCTTHQPIPIGDWCSTSPYLKPLPGLRSTNTEAKQSQNRHTQKQQTQAQHSQGATEERQAAAPSWSTTSSSWVSPVAPVALPISGQIPHKRLHTHTSGTQAESHQLHLMVWNSRDNQFSTRPRADCSFTISTHCLLPQVADTLLAGSQLLILWFLFLVFILKISIFNIYFCFILLVYFALKTWDVGMRLLGSHSC